MGAGLRRDDKLCEFPIEMAKPNITTSIRVGETDAGQRLDRILASHLPALSRTRLKRLILDGCVTEHGIVLCDPSLRVRCDQNFVVLLTVIEPG